MTGKQLQNLCEKWQGVLKLRDWEVKAVFVPVGDLKPGTAGYVSPSVNNKAAVIEIMREGDYKNQYWAQDVEETLVHELVHLHLIGLGDQEDPLKRRVEEQAVESLAQGFVSLVRFGGKQ